MTRFVKQSIEDGEIARRTCQWRDTQSLLKQSEICELKSEIQIASQMMENISLDDGCSSSETNLIEDLRELSIINKLSHSGINNDPTKNSLNSVASNSSDISVTYQDYENLFIPDEKYGDTTLHTSIVHKHEDDTFAIINMALELDVDFLNIKNNFHQTPAHLAVLTNSIKTIKNLIWAGADMMIQDRNGNTPLHLACQHGYKDILRELLISIRHAKTSENLHWCHSPVGSSFTAMSQNLSVRNYDGLTCLHIAVWQCDLHIIECLLEAGADPNCGDGKSGRTALHLASEFGMMNVVKLLAASNTDLHALNYAGHSAAMLAYFRGNMDIVEFLLQQSDSYDLELMTQERPG